MSTTIVEVSPNIVGTRYQWGVLDKRTNKLVRPALTREAARNKARLSKHYVVCRRTLTVGNWEVSNGGRREARRKYPPTRTKRGG